MQHLNEYLLSKTKNNAESYNFPEEYCILVMYDVYKHIGDAIKNKFEYACVPNNVHSNGSDYYVIPIKDGEKYTNYFGVVLYKIPDCYSTIEDLELDLKDGRIEEDELEVLNMCSKYY